MARFQIQVDSGNGRLVPFQLAIDDKGLPLYTSHLLEPVHISIYQQSQEARYANLLPGVGAVYAQDELSGGMGKKIQVFHEDPQFDHYYYTEWWDASIRGQGVKGPAVTNLSAPSNSGTLAGSFHLGGYLYLVLGRRIARWEPDALTGVQDFGVGNGGGQSTVFARLSTEAAAESQGTDTTSNALGSSDDRLAQAFRMAGNGLRFLSSVNVKLTRAGLATPASPSITNTGTGGAATWMYKVSATVTGAQSGVLVGETPVSAAGSIATGNPTLSLTNYNTIAWTAVPGATGYKIYRTGVGTSPATLGLIGSAAGLVTSFNDTGIAGDSSTPNATDTSCQIASDVRLSVMADLNGQPSMQIITSSSKSAMQIPMAATSTTFRFDDDDTMGLPFNVPFWLVLDCSGATPYQNIAWSRENTGTAYPRGVGKVSTDRGNTWSGTANSSAFNFTVSAKTDAATAFVASPVAGQRFKTSSDGVTYTPDAFRYANNFTVAGGKLVRSIQDGTLSSATGGIEWSADGVNWNSDIIVVGDPSVPITYLLTLGEIVIVCKEDGIFAVDLDPPQPGPSVAVEQLYISNRAASNGVGSCSWQGGAYIPFNGRLMAITGDFSAGFVVYESVGLEVLREWDWPWGQGKHVACAGTRHHLYSVVSSPTGYRLLKSADPLRKKADGQPNPEWHGSLATIGDGTQTVNYLAYSDGVGASTPQLFCSAKSDGTVARIQVPRAFNPSADSEYLFDTANTADLYFPIANGNYPLHPKAWLVETCTFQKATAGDYVDSLWDTLDGQGWRRLGRLYKSGALLYPRGLESQLLARRLRIVNNASTLSPQLLAHAISYAMRHIEIAAMREISFTVVAEDGLSAADLGEMLGLGARSQRALFATAAGTGLGTRRMEDPYGRVYERVLFLDATEVVQVTGQQGQGRTLIQVSAVGVGA